VVSAKAVGPGPHRRGITVTGAGLDPAPGAPASGGTSSA
jgi:hypothetical protein